MGLASAVLVVSDSFLRRRALGLALVLSRVVDSFGQDSRERRRSAW
jgi:hypothetical protein